MFASLLGKRTVVTGGGRGIGAGITRKLLDEGAMVAIVQRTMPPEALLTSQARFVRADVSRPVELKAAIDECISVLGDIDVLVNNAGIMFEKSVDEMTEEQWDSMMAVNLKAPYLLVKHALPSMRRRGRGSIINIGSIEGLASNPGHTAYSASKAGLHGMTAALAIDLGRDGIRCNAIAPGWIMSDLSEEYLASMPNALRFRREIVGMHPVGRLGRPEDVGALAAWLASDESDFVTGQVYVIDGGRTKKLPLPVTY